MYDDQKKAVEAARKEGVEELFIVVEGNDRQVSRFKMNREMLAEMLTRLSPTGDGEHELRPSSRLAGAMREAEGSLPVFRTKDELFDALEAAD